VADYCGSNCFHDRRTSNLPDHADFYLATGKFTIDFWVRFNGITTGGFLGIDDADDDQIYFFMSDSGTKIYFGVVTPGGGTIVNMVANVLLSINTWYHIALIRGWDGNANDWAITLNGSLEATVTDADAWSDLTSVFFVGRSHFGSQDI